MLEIEGDRKLRRFKNEFTTEVLSIGVTLVKNNSEKMIKIKLLLLFLLGAISVNGQKTVLGTEIWIEPGYSKTAITELVKISSEAGFKDIRIFMMWTHIEPQLDTWDFEVYDWMFEACEKYHLRLQVTLNPNQPAFHYGKEYCYCSDNHQHNTYPGIRMKLKHIQRNSRQEIYP